MLQRVQEQLQRLLVLRILRRVQLGIHSIQWELLRPKEFRGLLFLQQSMLERVLPGWAMLLIKLVRLRLLGL